MHEATLNSRFVNDGHAHNIVELGAIYAAAPSDFIGDGSGNNKTKWKLHVTDELKKMMARRMRDVAGRGANGNRVAPPPPAYQIQMPLFVGQGEHARSWPHQ